MSKESHLQTFKNKKATCLSKVDFSRKGAIDEAIVDLIDFINACDHYFTTSSCSGRISLFEEPQVRGLNFCCAILVLRKYLHFIQFCKT